MPATDVEIGWRTQVSTEIRPWQIDMAAEMDSGDAIGSVTAALTDLLDGTAYEGGLSGGATFSGTTVSQTVAALAPGHSYRLVLTAAMGGSKQTSTVLLLSCPF